MKCKALYDFTASDTDEISIATGETLEIISDDDGTGWILVVRINGFWYYVNVIRAGMTNKG